MPQKPTYEQLEKQIREFEKTEIENSKSLSTNDKKFFSAAFGKHGAVVLLIEPDSGAIVDANPAAQNYYGYSVDTLKNMNIQDINVSDEEDVAEKLNLAADEKQNFFIFSHRLSGGEIRTVEVHSSPVLLKGRKFLLSIINDTTEKMHLDKTLKGINITLNQMLDGTQDMIAFQKPDHTIIRYNRAGYELLGMPPEEVNGKKCYELIGRDKECEICASGKALKSKRLETIEKYQPELNRYIKAVANPVLNDEGEIIYIIEQVTDISSQKRTEDELRNSQMLLSELTNQIPGVLFQFYSRPNGEKGLYYVSEKSKSTFGIDPDTDDIFGRFTEMVIPEHREAFIESIDEAIRNISEWRFEGILEKINGDRTWFSAHSIPNLVKGEVIFNGLVQDITRLKKTEEELVETRDKYIALFNQSPEGIHVHDVDGQITEVNRMACLQTGYSKEELLKMSVFDLHPKRKDTINLPKDEILRQWASWKPGEGTYIEAEHQGKDGAVMPVQITTRKIKLKNSDSLMAVVQDITQRKRAEKYLRENEKRYRTILQTTIDGFWMTDADGNLLQVNDAYSKMSGYSEEELLSMKVNDLEVNTPEKISKRTQEIIRNGFARFETKHRRKDGSTFNVDVSLQSHPDKSDTFFSFTRDITERKLLEEHLQQTQKIEGIGTLAGGIAHDFNNILSPIMMHAEMAMDDLETDHPLYHSMNEIFRAGKRAKDLVQQILTFARKKPEKRIVLKASLIVKEAVKFLRSTIPTTIDIECDIRSGQDKILADPTQMNQILMNLCTNAAHAMKEKGGLLEVILDNEYISIEKATKSLNLKHGRYLKISVSDNGTGIAPDVIDKIFEPYYTTKQTGEGTGLGLATVHGIVQTYGGDIVVESKVGKGTVFKVYIPLTGEELEETVEPKTGIPKGYERILIVDDEKASIDIMKKMLQRFGYRVTAMTKSIEALELFRKNPEEFDLVITDMTMPNMTGENLTKELMAIDPDIRVILCTGFSDKIDEEKAREIGINAFIMKPIVMKDMIRIIREVLDKK